MGKTKHGDFKLGFKSLHVQSNDIRVIKKLYSWIPVRVISLFKDEMFPKALE